MEAGCEPARFWTITPIEAAREMQGRASIRRHEQNQLAYLAWHIEALSRMNKMPRLDEMMQTKSASNRKPPDRETLEMNIKLAFGYPGEKSQ